MFENKINLLNEFNSSLWKKSRPDYLPSSEILSNLNPRITLREYQDEALCRFHYYIEDFDNKCHPTHLLFNMATGSGKTIVMAANILYLYTKGYRNFIFFVNSKNVIEKTRANFLDKISPKYLFAEKISFNHQEINIVEVDNFEAVNENDINIHFTTIQGLHSNLTEPRENRPTFEEFSRIKLVLLSDEAHHINTLTKKGINKSEEELETSWENTVQNILRSNPENILLEYTATIDIKNPLINQKYQDKILYEYDLKHFHLDKYSKEIKLLNCEMDQKLRIIQAIILSQYRRKVAEKHGIFLKPCILFKSPRIAESIEARKGFDEIIKDLNISDFEEIKKYSGTTLLKEAFRYFEKNEITTHNLILELKEDFRPERIIELNSNQEIEDKNKQLNVNNLEAHDNELRAIFVVNMLNEGWDVLNLFDIVRLDESKGTKNATISEAQLIGRGARYFPFELEGGGDKYRRRFDNEPRSELSCLEELYYHSVNQSEYIDDLKDELKKMGINPDPEKKIVFVKVKDSIKQTDFWKNGLVYSNSRDAVKRDRIKSIRDIANKDLSCKIDLGADEISESFLLTDEEKQVANKSDKVILFSDIELPIRRKAIDRDKFFKFSNLKISFPHLKSIDEFISSKDYCGNYFIEFSGSRRVANNLTPQIKLRAASALLDVVKEFIISNSNDFRGTKEFRAENIRSVVADKQLHFTIQFGERHAGVSMKKEESSDYRYDLDQANWFVFDDNFGTSEEKALIKLIASWIEQQENFEDIYLLRNENYIELFDFEQGRRFLPDFILFMKDRKSGKQLSYQLFIEPKGAQLIEHDQWKEDFFQKIEDNAVNENSLFFENTDYHLVGLPFFNEQNKFDFLKALNDLF